MATCAFCADELPEGARFCPSCGASAGGGTSCPSCNAVNALMATHCNQCGASLAQAITTSGEAPAPGAPVDIESATPAEPTPLPEWLFLEETVSASEAGPREALADSGETWPVREAAIPSSEDLAAALRELSRAEEPASPPHEELGRALSNELAAALRDLPPELLAPREEPDVPAPPTDDLDKALRDLLGQPSPLPEPSPPPRLEDEGEFYRWLQQAMHDAPTEGDSPEGER